MVLSHYPQLRHQLARGVLVVAVALGMSITPTQVAVAAAGDGIAAYISPPFVQGPPSSFGASIETFDSATSCTLPRTNPSVGTFSGGCTSVNSSIGDHIFGGASTTSDQPTVGGTASTFAAAWNTQQLSVAFSTPVRYVGFWWSAGSSGNKVEIYAADGSTLLETFTTDSINLLLNTSGASESSVLPPPVNQYPGSQVVTALDGSEYLKGYYFGRPADHTTLTPTVLPRGVNGNNTYNTALNIYSHAYLNVYASGSITFGKIKFIGGGFEFDNLAVSTSQQSPPSNQVLLQSVLGKSVNFRANGGSGSMTPQTSDAATTLTTNSFTRPGYTFAGWHTTDSGTGGTSYGDQDQYGFVSDMTLYAQWTANTLVVTHDTQGGTNIAPGSTTTGTSISTSPGTPTREGYTFAGWFTSASGGTAISFPYAHGQTAAFTLFAQWTAVPTSTEATTTTTTTIATPTPEATPTTVESSATAASTTTVATPVQKATIDSVKPTKLPATGRSTQVIVILAVALLILGASRSRHQQLT